MRLYAELGEVLDRNAIVIGDGGDFVSYAGRVIDSYEPGCWLDPGPFGCLGSGPGYALAAKLAHPDRQVVLLLGDGAFGFSGMEYDTLARHGVNVVGVMGNNGIWALEKHPMEFLYGYSVAADLRPETRYDQVVEALGGHGELVREPGELQPALERAFAVGQAGARQRAHRPVGRLPALVEPGVAAPPLAAAEQTPSKREAARGGGGRLHGWPRQDGQGYVPWGAYWVARTAGGAVDAASPGPMRQRTAAGGTTALADRTILSACREAATIKQTSRNPPYGGYQLDVVDRPVSSAAPQRMSRSETSTSASPNARQRAGQHHHAGDDRGRPIGVEAGHLAALARAGSRRARRAWRAGARRDSRWPSTSRPSAPEVDARGLRRRAGHGDRGGDPLALRPPGPPRRAPRSTSAASAASSSRAGGSECRWRSEWRTTPTWVETWNATSPPSPTTSSVEPPPMSITSSRSPAGASRAVVAPR